MKWVLISLKWAVTIPLVIVLVMLTHGWLGYLPNAIYRLRSPDAASECSRIQPGMDLAEVLRIVNGRVEPQDQTYSGDRAVFYRGDHGSCVVDFDQVTHRVSKAHFQESNIILME